MPRRSAKPKAYSYVRFSRPEQMKGDSLRRQTALSEQYAKDNGLELDTSLVDKGVSAFRGKNTVEGALGRFLAAVEAGTVKAGSILIVESLDRLSRQSVESALAQFLALINAGIVVVTLGDNQRYEKGRLELTQLIISLTVMSRAHEESATKSKRISHAWANKRANIATKPLTGRLPGWLTLKAGKIVEVPERVALVKRMFAMTAEGKGRRIIAKTFNRESQEAWGVGKQRADGWQDSYVQKTLRNRQVLGEYQPHQMIAGKRTPVGDVVPDYFPRVISDQEFYLAQNSLTTRTRKGGRVGDQVNNLFANLSVCAQCGGTVIILDKRGPKNRNGLYLKCSATNRGLKNCEPASMLYPHVEDAFIAWLVDFDFSGGQSSVRTQKEAELAVALGERAKAQKRLDWCEGQIGEANAPKNLARIMKEAEETIEKHDQTAARLAAEIEGLTETITGGNFAELAAKPENRLRLREEIRKRVKQIRFHFGDTHPNFQRPCFVVELADGDAVEIVDKETIVLVRKGKRYEYEGGRRLTSDR